MAIRACFRAVYRLHGVTLNVPSEILHSPAGPGKPEIEVSFTDVLEAGTQGVGWPCDARLRTAAPN